MKRISKSIAVVLASTLTILLLTGCEAQEVIREVQVVREVVVREEPGEVIVKEIPAPVVEEKLEDELLAIMNDSLIYQSFTGTSSRIREYKADPGMESKAAAVQDIVATVITTDGISMNNDRILSALREKLVELGDTSIYHVTYVRDAAYKSKYFNANKTDNIAAQMRDNCVEIHATEDGSYRPEENTTAQVGFRAVTVGNNNYMIAVIKVPAVEVADEED